MSELIAVPGFDIEKLIAKGGMAAVYLATQKSLNRQVALKIMDNTGEDVFSERFLNEGRLIASLNHPNVITIYDLGLLDNGKAYLSMEYIDGGDLETKMQQEHISAEQAVEILRSLMKCLQYVHKHDVVHRDIKPGNILFRSDGTLVLTDFGIAKKSDVDVNLTQEGMAVGSPGYMSPEQAQALNIDRRSDIYSVGVIFAELLMGKNPFKADSHIATAMNHINMDLPVLPFEFRKYQTLLNQMLAKDPDDRFFSATALLNYLNKIPKFGAMVSEESESEEEIYIPPIETKSPLSFLEKYSAVIFIGLLALFIIGGGYFYKIAETDHDIVQFLEKADVAYRADRLMLPEQASAYYYWQTVLNLDANNEEARKGMQKLVNRYTQLAENANRQRQFDKMAKYIDRGLSIEPDNARLNELKRKLP